MSSNSVFDDLGIGASDLGLSKDPKKIAKDNEKKLNQQKAEAADAKTKSEAEAFDKENKQRMAGGMSRSSTLLTGAQGISEDEDGASITRRTLLGS